MKFFLTLATLIFFITGCAPKSSESSGGGGNTIDPGVTTFEVSAPSAPSSFTINGNGNPSLTLKRGQTYTFNINAAGHPFYIMSVQGVNTANAYTNGVTGNGTQSGTLTFVVPAGAPDTLYYNCSIHGSMTGTIAVTN